MTLKRIDINPLKSAAEAAFRHFSNPSQKSGFDLKPLLLVISVFCTNFFFAAAQSNSTLPAPCRQCFLVKIAESISLPNPQIIDSTFKHFGFTRCKMDIDKYYLQLECPKGCSLVNVKQVLDDLALEATLIKEEYTNKPEPLLFKELLNTK
jgi:hypothetical protein